MQAPFRAGFHAQTLGRAKLGLLTNNNYQWGEKRAFAAEFYSKEKKLRFFWLQNMCKEDSTIYSN